MNSVSNAIRRSALALTLFAFASFGLQGCAVAPMVLGSVVPAAMGASMVADQFSAIAAVAGQETRQYTIPVNADKVYYATIKVAASDPNDVAAGKGKEVKENFNTGEVLKYINDLYVMVKIFHADNAKRSASISVEHRSAIQATSHVGNGKTFDPEQIEAKREKFLVDLARELGISRFDIKRIDAKNADNSAVDTAKETASKAFGALKGLFGK